MKPETKQCCERDIDHDGNCDRHPAKSTELRPEGYLQRYAETERKRKLLAKIKELQELIEQP